MTNDETNSHLLVEEPIGSMVTAEVHVFQIQFSALVQARWMQPVRPNQEKRKQKTS